MLIRGSFFYDIPLYSSERLSTPREIRVTSGVWLDSLNQPTCTRVRILLGMLLDELEEANPWPEIRYFTFRVSRESR